MASLVPERVTPESFSGLQSPADLVLNLQGWIYGVRFTGLVYGVAVSNAGPGAWAGPPAIN